MKNCPLCLGGACMWSVTRDDVTTCEPPYRLLLRKGVEKPGEALFEWDIPAKPPSAATQETPDPSP